MVQNQLWLAGIVRAHAFALPMGPLDMVLSLWSDLLFFFIAVGRERYHLQGANLRENSVPFEGLMVGAARGSLAGLPSIGI